MRKRSPNARAYAVKRQMTLAEVAAELGISRERVRQIEASALRKLRRAFQAAGYTLEDLA